MHLPITVKVRLLAFAAAVAATWGVVAADDAAARFSKPEARASVDIAWDYWRSLDPGGARRQRYACGPASIRLTWVPFLESAMAFAGIGGCRDPYPKIWLERRTIRSLEDVHGCSVLTHEVGHLLGYRHVKASKQLMSGDPTSGRKPPEQATWDRARRRCARAL
jgi:hypothetical protein